MSFPDLEARLASVRERIEAARASSGVRQEVEIVAVTKSHPADAILAAVGAGLRCVGENRVQEALSKQDELGDCKVDWHLIGHLQTNKAKYLPGRFAMVQSIDSSKVARAVDKASGKAGIVQRVLVQVNVAGETQKFGCEPTELDEMVDIVKQLPNLELRGLMTMAPFTDDERVQRETFASARRLFESIECEGEGPGVLSMGMSGDFEAAVAEGATHVRLGTVLFGERV